MLAKQSRPQDPRSSTSCPLGSSERATALRLNNMGGMQHKNVRKEQDDEASSSVPANYATLSSFPLRNSLYQAGRGVSCWREGSHRPEETIDYTGKRHDRNHYDRRRFQVGQTVSRLPTAAPFHLHCCFNNGDDEAHGNHGIGSLRRA